MSAIRSALTHPGPPPPLLSIVGAIPLLADDVPAIGLAMPVVAIWAFD